MARIPQQSPVAPRFAGVDVPQGAFSAPTKAVAQLMQTVGGAFDDVLQLGIEAQQIRNRNDIREEARAMQQLEASFRQEILESGMDPAEWPQQWAQRLQGHQEALKSKNFPPVVRGELSAKMEDFSMRSTLSISGEAFKENRRIAKGSAMLDYKDQMARGFFGDARQTIKDNANLFDDLEMKQLTMGVAREEGKATRAIDLEADPLQYKEDVKAGKYGLSKIGVAEELVKAGRVVNRKKHEAVSAVADMIKAEEIEGEEHLNEVLDKFTEISPSERKLLVMSLKKDIPIPDAERFALGDKIRADYRAFREEKTINLDEYRDRWRKNATLVRAYGERPAGAGGALKNLIYQKDPVHIDPHADEAKEREKARVAAEKDFEGNVAELVRVRAQGVTSVTKERIGQRFAERAASRKKKDDRKITPQEVVDIARLGTKEDERYVKFRVELERRMREWISTLPTQPTMAEVEDYMNKIQPGVVTSITARGMTSGGQAPKNTLLPASNTDEEIANQLLGE